MSITVRDCLFLPTLSLGYVAAGENGLNNIVNRIDVIEFILDEDEFATPNVLFITAFHAIRDNVEAQCRALYRYKKLGASAVVLFYSDLVIHSLDRKVIQTADELNLPIIKLPGSDLGLHYCDVIEEVMEAIFIDRKQFENILSNTLDMISRLTPDRQNIRTLLEFASGFVKSSLFLCDNANRLIDSACWPRNNSIDQLQEVISSFDSHDMPDNVSTVRLTYGITSFYRKGFTVKPQTDLILYASCRNNVLSSLSLDQITEMIRIFVSIWNYNLDFSNRNSMLTLLLTGNYELVGKLSADNAIDLSEYDTLLIAERRSDYNDTSESSISSRLCKELPPDAFLSETTAEREIALIKSDSSTGVLADPYKLAFLSRYRFITVEEHFDPFSLKEFYTGYCNSLDAITKIFRMRSVFSAEQIKFADWCLRLNEGSSHEKSTYLEKLSLLRDPKHKDTLETVETFLLDAGSEIKTTAELLYIHRNTVQHRLRKVQEITGLNAAVLPDSYTLYVAAALHRISQVHAE